MKNSHKKLDSIEAALLELDAAERAGLFEPTRLDSGMLLTADVGGRDTGHGRRTLRWLSIASAAAVVLFVWGSMFSAQLDSLRKSDRVADASLVDANSGCDGSFVHCFSGPTQLVLAGCVSHDYDADGDVDLADFSTFQRGCAGRSSIP